DGDRFVDAARRVAAGESALDPEVVSHLLGRRRATKSPVDDLTERERTVLEEMAEGRSNGAIAERMFLSDRAVERHVSAIFSKLALAASPDSHRRGRARVPSPRGAGGPWGGGGRPRRGRAGGRARLARPAWSRSR